MKSVSSFYKTLKRLFLKADRLSMKIPLVNFVYRVSGLEPDPNPLSRDLPEIIQAFREIRND